jgi:hypothetical protein
MATRFVFKFFGSIGPAGSMVGLVEKMCTALYPHAYQFGDESQVESQVDRDLKKIREQYINDIFKLKNKFQKNTMPGTQDDKKDEQYTNLVKLIKIYIDKMTRMEKNKYMRERLFYQRENQIVLYEEANKKYHECQDVVSDNLIKQARTIVKPDPEEFELWLKKLDIDLKDSINQGELEHINEAKSMEFMNAWNEIRNNFVKEKREINKKSESELTEEQRTVKAIFTNGNMDEIVLYLKDRLFIEMGEDVEDIFLSFKVYDLMHKEIKIDDKDLEK